MRPDGIPQKTSARKSAAKTAATRNQVLTSATLRAAELLGVNANTLASRLRGLGISRNYSALTPATPAAR